MRQFNWGYTQFSQFNADDTLLLVSGVYLGPHHSSSGEIAVISLGGCRRMTEVKKKRRQRKFVFFQVAPVTLQTTTLCCPVWGTSRTTCLAAGSTRPTWSRGTCTGSATWRPALSCGSTKLFRWVFSSSLNTKANWVFFFKKKTLPQTDKSALFYLYTLWTTHFEHFFTRFKFTSVFASLVINMWQICNYI